MISLSNKFRSEFRLGGRPFSSALYSRTANTTNIGFDYVASWDDQIHDYGGWYNGANPTRLTVPEKVQLVRVTVSLMFDTQARWLYSFLQKNGSELFFGNPTSSNSGDSASPRSRQNICTPVLPVVTGDYFEVKITSQTNDRTLWSGSNCHFGIEAW